MMILPTISLAMLLLLTRLNQLNTIFHWQLPRKIKEMSGVKPEHELGLEKHSSRRWMRRFCHYYKLLTISFISLLYFTSIFKQYLDKFRFEKSPTEDQESCFSINVELATKGFIGIRVGQGNVVYMRQNNTNISVHRRAWVSINKQN